MLAPFLQEGQLRPVQEMLLTGRSAQLQLIVGVKEARLIDRPPMHARRYVTGSAHIDATMRVRDGALNSLQRFRFRGVKFLKIVKQRYSLCGSSRQNSL